MRKIKEYAAKGEKRIDTHYDLEICEITEITGMSRDIYEAIHYAFYMGVEAGARQAERMTARA